MGTAQQSEIALDLNLQDVDEIKDGQDDHRENDENPEENFEDSLHKLLKISDLRQFSSFHFLELSISSTGQ